MGGKERIIRPRILMLIPFKGGEEGQLEVEEKCVVLWLIVPVDLGGMSGREIGGRRVVLGELIR